MRRRHPELQFHSPRRGGGNRRHPDHGDHRQRQTIEEYDSSGNPAYGNNTASTDVISTLANHYTVSSTADTGTGSLREAIDDVDANGGAATIDFAIGTGQQTIDVFSPLPAITAPVIIDGTTQPGYSGTPLIELDGAGAGAGSARIDDHGQ